uniref:Uncharacterized protein n=1 Tax=Grammatophora oceanica TaxID=210454 RepID=A0A7S1VM74_9STRA
MSTTTNQRVPTMQGLSLSGAALPEVVLFSFDGNTPEILHAKERATSASMAAAKQGSDSLFNLVYGPVENLLDRMNANLNNQRPQYKFILPDEKEHPGSKSALQMSFWRWNTVLLDSHLQSVPELLAENQELQHQNATKDAEIRILKDELVNQVAKTDSLNTAIGDHLQKGKARMMDEINAIARKNVEKLEYEKKQLKDELAKKELELEQMRADFLSYISQSPKARK